MKDLFKIIFLFSIVVIVYIFKDNISNFITDNIIYQKSNKILTYNEYYLDKDYLYVQNIDDSKVENKQQLLNMFYSIINSGDNNYSFYCEYQNCLDDMKDLIKDEVTLSDISNFVHPFNSFSDINIDISTDGKIDVKVKKTYSDDEIAYVKLFIDNFISENISDDMNVNDKIKAFHDYIINNTEYDENNNHMSYTAYSLLKTNKSICGGYSDIMSIYLNALGIDNYKIASKNHVWNLVKIDDKWYHLDMTWDDPVASDGKQYLIHNFFLISTEELFKLDNVEHNFDKEVYLEAN